jgi:hypothetical protein
MTIRYPLVLVLVLVLVLLLPNPSPEPVTKTVESLVTTDDRRHEAGGWFSE